MKTTDLHKEAPTLDMTDLNESKLHDGSGEDSPLEQLQAALPTQVDLPDMEGMETNDLWDLYSEKRALRQQYELELVRNELIERHRPLVRFIALRMLQTLPKSVELDDLISAGIFGLMDAIRGFDTSRGIKFKTYCSTRIRGSILDQLRSEDWVPRLVRVKAGKIDKALQKLTSEYGREPTHAELAQAMKLDHSTLHRELDEAKPTSIMSLADTWQDQDDDNSADKIGKLQDKSAEDPTRPTDNSDVMDYMTRALTDKETFIVEQYYRVGHTLREIGEMLGLTESRVCQIHSSILSRLQDQISMCDPEFS